MRDGKFHRILKNTFWLAVVGVIGYLLYTCAANDLRRTGDRAAQQQKQYELENGRWVETPAGTPKNRVETKSTLTPRHGGMTADVSTNCRDPLDHDFFVEPGESVQIRQNRSPDNPLLNRCAYNQLGDHVPIYGNKDKPSGMPDDTIRQQYQMDLPFPYFRVNGKKIPAIGGEMVFVLCDPDHCTLDDLKVYAFDYIKHKGGVANLHNSFGKRLKWNVFYNYMIQFQQDPVRRQQIGHDGSRAMFVVTRYDPKKENPGNITIVRPGE